MYMYIYIYIYMYGVMRTQTPLHRPSPRYRTGQSPYRTKILDFGGFASS